MKTESRISTEGRAIRKRKATLIGGHGFAFSKILKVGRSVPATAGIKPCILDSVFN